MGLPREGLIERRAAGLLSCTQRSRATAASSTLEALAVGMMRAEPPEESRVARALDAHSYEAAPIAEARVSDVRAR